MTKLTRWSIGSMGAVAMGGVLFVSALIATAQTRPAQRTSWGEPDLTGVW